MADLGSDVPQISDGDLAADDDFRIPGRKSAVPGWLYATASQLAVKVGSLLFGDLTGQAGKAIIVNEYENGFDFGDSGGDATNVSPTDTGPCGYLSSSPEYNSWRILIHEDYGGDSPQMAEIEFRPIVDTAHAPGAGTAFAGNYYDTNVPDNAFNGNTADFWHANGGFSGGLGTNHIGYDHDTPLAVRQVMLTLRNHDNGLAGAFKVFDVQYNDGVDWVTEWSVEDGGFTTNGETRLFDNPNPVTNTHFYPTLLAALNDVDLTGIADGQGIAWDESEGKFLPIDFPTGGGGGGGESDVVAKARIDWDSAGVATITTEENVASITRLGAGQFEVTFTDAVPAGCVALMSGRFGTVAGGAPYMTIAVAHDSGAGVNTTDFQFNVLDQGTLTDPYAAARDDSWVYFEIKDPTVASGGGGGGGGAPWYFDPPTTAVFDVPISAGSGGTVTDDPDAGLCITQQGGGAYLVGAMKAIPSPAADWEAYMRMDFFASSANYSNRSLVVSDGSNNKSAWWGYDSRGSTHFMHYLLSGSYDGYEVLTGMVAAPQWYKLSYVAATGIITYSISGAGKGWIPIGTNDVKSYLGTDPQFIGLFAGVESGSQGADMAVTTYVDDM